VGWLTLTSGNEAGKLCAGTWNRNTGGGIPDYTTCNATGKTGTVYVVASGSGASSNPLPIFVHPKVTSVVLGNPTASHACAANDDAVDANSPVLQLLPALEAVYRHGSAYVGNSCISQSDTRQLVARAFDANGTSITCKVGH